MPGSPARSLKKLDKAQLKRSLIRFGFAAAGAVICLDINRERRAKSDHRTSCLRLFCPFRHSWIAPWLGLTVEGVLVWPEPRYRDAIRLVHYLPQQRLRL